MIVNESMTPGPPTFGFLAKPSPLRVRPCGEVRAALDGRSDPRDSFGQVSGGRLDGAWRHLVLTVNEDVAKVEGQLATGGLRGGDMPAGEVKDGYCMACWESAQALLSA
jgi:hypothetical protein